MFASSQYPITAARERSPGGAAPLHGGEGRESEASCRASLSLLLLANGRPSPWLLLLAGCCLYVVAAALVSRI